MREKIIRILKENKLTPLKELVFRIGENERAIRREISQMPEVGVKVKGGYFLIENQNELQETINNLYSRAISLMRRARKIKNAYNYNKSEKLFRIAK